MSNYLEFVTRLRIIQTKCTVTQIEWETPSQGSVVTPPSNTIAITVDLVKSPGAIHIREGDTWIDGIFIDDVNGHLVIVPWDNKWSFRVAGSPRIGYAT